MQAMEAMQFSQPQQRTRPHHRRVPSDPFEFDEPGSPEAGSSMFASLKCPADNFDGSIYFDDDDTAMTVVDDSLTSGSDSDDSNDCVTMAEDFDFADSASASATNATNAGECCSGHRSLPTVKHEGPASDELWNDVDSWMLNMDAPTDKRSAGNGGGSGSSWLNSCEISTGAFDLIPVGGGGPERCSSFESSMSSGVTPTALPVMSPCSNGPSPAPFYDGAFSVGEKRARFSTGASPLHRMVKVNRNGCARSTAIPAPAPAPADEDASPYVPMASGDGSGGGTDCEPPPLLQKPLPAEVAARMLSDDSYDPGARPVIFNAAAGQWLFKETNRGGAPNGRCTASGPSSDRADRWHNSGGVRGARDMPKNAAPLVRRRYGSVAQNGEILWRFHEYSALKVIRDPAVPGGQRVDEDRSTVVFHVMPKRSGKGRPSKAEAELPAQMWKAFGFGLER